MASLQTFLSRHLAEFVSSLHDGQCLMAVCTGCFSTTLGETGMACGESLRSTMSAMVPCANLLGFAGQELARKLPKVAGILIETALGSVVEIILFMVLIVKDNGVRESHGKLHLRHSSGNPGIDPHQSSTLSGPLLLHWRHETFRTIISCHHLRNWIWSTPCRRLCSAYPISILLCALWHHRRWW